MPGLIVIGIVLLFSAIAGVFSTVPHSKKIKGTIVTTEYVRSSGNGRGTYKATVEYTVGTEKYYVKSNYRSSSFREGQTLTVVYNELNPGEAVLRPLPSTYIIMAILLACGVYMAITSFMMN